MIKGKVYNYLHKYFAEYLFGFDKSQLEVALLSGQIDLKDVNFRPNRINQILESLRLPFVLKAGMIGKLRLKYNLLSCISSPFEVYVDDLQLILGPSMGAISNDDSFIHDEDAGAPYDSTNCYNIFTHNIKLSKKGPSEESPNSNEPPVTESCLFNILKNMALTISKLHIRYEDDYFAHSMPFAFGIICNGLSSYIVNNEWQFGSIENSKFIRTVPKDPEKLLIRETNLKNIRVYWKSPAEMFVPLSLYESTKDLENQIFDAIPLEDMRHMMHQSFADDNLVEEFSLFSSIAYNSRDTAAEEARANRRSKMKADILLTKLCLNIRPNIMENMCMFKEYAQNLAIMHELKNYRPKRRPIVSPKEIEISKAIIGVTALERKRKLIVRDWFFFAVWANRIKNLIKKGNKMAQNDKTREFQRLYTRLIPKQHKPLQDSLRIGRPVRTEEGSFTAGTMRDSEEYLAGLEAKIANEEEASNAFKARIMKFFCDTKLAVRLQEFSVGLYSTNCSSRVVNGQKKPLIELDLLNPGIEVSFSATRINFAGVISELQLYHYLKNLQNSAERLSSLSETQRPPVQKTRAPLKSPVNVSVDTSRSSEPTHASSPLKVLAKTFKDQSGESVTRWCIGLIKGCNGFGLKFAGTDETISVKRNVLNLHVEMGDTNVELYALAMEDFCEALVNYRELYWFRGCSSECNTPPISPQKKEHMKKYRKRSIENQVEVQDEDIKDVEGEVRAIQDYSKLKRGTSQIPQKSAWLSCLDEFTLNTNLQIKFINGKMNYAIYDSARHGNKACMIQSKAFSVASVPGTTFTLSKEREAMSFSAFGFNFMTTKPAAFTTFFLNKLKMIYESVGMSEFIREYQEFYKAKHAKIEEKRKINFNREEALRLIQMANVMKTPTLSHHHQSVVQSYCNKQARNTKSRPSAKCPNVGDLLNSLPIPFPEHKMLPTKSHNRHPGKKGDRLPEEDPSIVESDTSRGHYRQSPHTTERKSVMDIIDDDSNPSIPRTNGETGNAQRMNQYFANSTLKKTATKSDLVKAQSTLRSIISPKSLNVTPHHASSHYNRIRVRLEAEGLNGRESPDDAGSVDELSGNINQVFKFPAFSKYKKGKPGVPINAFTHS